MKNYQDVLEDLLTSKVIGLFQEPFMIEAFGQDVDYDIDYDTERDTDMDRNPITKKQILIQIEDVSEETFENVFEGGSLHDNIRKWADQYDVVFDGIYTGDDGVTIVFDVPEDGDVWKYGQDALKEVGVGVEDDIDAIAEEEWKKFIAEEKPRVSFDDFLAIFKMGSQCKAPKSKEKKKAPEPPKKENKEVEEYKSLVDAELQAKYNTKISDISIEDSEIEENMKNNKSVSVFVSELSNKFDLVPVTSSGKKSSFMDDDDSETSKYICVLTSAEGKEVGRYEVSTKDEKYAKMFLEAIGVKTKFGDKITFE